MSICCLPQTFFKRGFRPRRCFQQFDLAVVLKNSCWCYTKVHLEPNHRMGFRGLKDLRLTGHIICLANLVLIPYSSMFVKGFNPPNYCIRKPGLQRRITAKAQREMLLLMDQVIFRDYRDVSVLHTGPKVPVFGQKLKCENRATLFPVCTCQTFLVNFWVGNANQPTL